MEMIVEIRYCGLTFCHIEHDVTTPFEYGCHERTSIVREHLANNPECNKSNHHSEDYVVEFIHKEKSNEIWELGS